MTRASSFLVALLLLAGCGQGPQQPLFTAGGRVLDDQGQPVAGAVVSDGLSGALTDESGKYRLPVFKTALTVTKPGYGTAHLEANRSVAPVTTLAAVEERPVVAIDTRWTGSDTQGLRTTLASAAASVQEYPAKSLAGVDVLVEVTPGTLDGGELDRLGRWVAAGGRLVLAGEWGGYPYQDLGSLNALANPAGISFTGASVKGAGAEPGSDSWDSVATLNPPSLAKLIGPGDDDHLYLYTSSALSLTPAAVPMLNSGPDKYSVLSTGGGGGLVLAAVGPAGQGKVFALADSSLWKDEDSAGDGTPDIQRGANARLIDALVAW